MARILLVEDEQGLAGAIKTWLTDEQHAVDIVATGKRAVEKLDSTKYDVILLDWLLPELSGIEVCRHYRQNKGTTPVLMITAKGSVLDKETGLDSGADDYITKPFHLRELSARIRALLRRPLKRAVSCLETGNITLNPLSLTVTKNSEAIHLLPKEFALLENLMRKQNEIITIGELIDKVWGVKAEITMDTVRSNIKSLRRKIAIPGEPSIIVTVHGIGYKIENSHT